MKERLVNLIDDKKNLIVSGNISSGKTTNILFPLVDKIVENNESLFILDSKEEYLNKYYETLKNKNYNIVIINLRNPLNSEGWNPLLYPYELYKAGKKDEALDFLDKISEGIFYEKTAMDPFWSKTASDIFTASVLGLYHDAKEEEINLSSVASILDNFSTKLGSGTYSTDYFNLKGPNSDVYRYAKAIVSAPVETKGGILSVARQKLRLYVSRENLNVMLSQTTFDINDCLSKPTAIFLINHDEKTTYSRIATMFISQLYSMLLKKGEMKFNFIIDNFDTLDSFDDLNNILSSCVARDVKFFIATRSLKQLEDEFTFYIKNLAHVIIIKKDKVEFIIDDEKEVFEKEFNEVNINGSNIIYPNLENKNIEIFNVIDYVNSKKRISISKELMDKDGHNIDDLIKKIDEKIEELEKKEKI